MLKRDKGVVRALHVDVPTGACRFRTRWPARSSGYLDVLLRLDVPQGDRCARRGHHGRPRSPICGKVAVRTYPVGRLGLVFVWIGDERSR
jgi:hypothetical protein